jgi:hypothetical protein
MELIIIKKLIAIYIEYIYICPQYLLPHIGRTQMTNKITPFYTAKSKKKFLLYIIEG